jgi:hypothetical protein
MHSLLTARNGNVQLSLVFLLNAQCSTHNLLESYKINRYLATQKLTHSQDLGPLYKLLYSNKIACIKVQLPSDMTPRWVHASADSSSLQSWITRSAEAIMTLELIQFTTTTASDLTLTRWSFKSLATWNHHLTLNTSKNTTSTVTGSRRGYSWFRAIHNSQRIMQE